MKTKLILRSVFFTTLVFAQEDNSFFSKFEIAANYGLAGNFFVDYGRDLNTDSDGIIPIYSEVFDEFQLYQKNFIGTSGGVNISFNFNDKNAITLGFDRNINQGRYNGRPILDNGTIVYINDIMLRHRNHFYSLTYRRSLNKKIRFTPA